MKSCPTQGRCAHRLGCAKTCQQPSSKLCQSIAPASFVIAWRRRQYHATEVWINCFEPWSYQYFAKFLSFQINFLAITPSSNQIILFIINKLNLFFTIKKIWQCCQQQRGTLKNHVKLEPMKIPIIIKFHCFESYLLRQVWKILFLQYDRHFLIFDFCKEIKDIILLINNFLHN